MEILVSSILSYEIFKTFQRFHLFRGKYYRINKLITFILYPLIILLFMGLIYFVQIYKLYQLKTLLVIVIGFVIILLLFFCLIFSYFAMPKITYKKQKKTIDGSTDFIFTKDTIQVNTIGTTYSGNSTMQYNHLFKAYETKDYIYLYINKRSAYGIRKADITKGTVEELTTLLKNNLGSKYIKCK